MKVDLVEAAALYDHKFIIRHKHPTLPLRMLLPAPDINNTNDIFNHQGLIIDENGEVLARPFKKFVNFDSLNPIPDEPYEVFEMYDGALGITYWYNDQLYLATKDGFDTVDAQIGMLLLQNEYKNVKFDSRFTYLFEIIHPDNKHLVDYKGLKELILLAVFDTETGREVPYTTITNAYLDLVVAKRIDLVFDLPNLRKRVKRNDTEGFIIRFKSGLRAVMRYDKIITEAVPLEEVMS